MHTHASRFFEWIVETPEQLGEYASDVYTFELSVNCSKLANSMPQAIFLLNKSLVDCLQKQLENSTWMGNKCKIYTHQEIYIHTRMHARNSELAPSNPVSISYQSIKKKKISDGKRKDVMIVWYKKIIIICSRKLLCIIRKCSKYKRNNGLMIHTATKTFSFRMSRWNHKTKYNEIKSIHTTDLWSSHKNTAKKNEQQQQIVKPLYFVCRYRLRSMVTVACLECQFHSWFADNCNRCRLH